MYELYHHENVDSTPFETVVLNSIASGQNEYNRVEMKLLVDFLVSIPRIGKTKVLAYIAEVEKNPEAPAQVPDIQNYINIHLSKMP